MWKQSCGLVIAISNHYHHETLVCLFFHFIGLSVCRKNERASLFQFSRFFNELREEAEREWFCLGFSSSLHVSPKLFFLIFFYLRRKNKTEKHTHQKKNECFSFILFIPCFELCRIKIAVRKRKQYVRWSEVTDFVSADRLRHTESCRHRQFCVAFIMFIFWKISFHLWCFLLS